MFIELHAIQNFAPSNLNRDDTGNPKDAEFGGVRRARISSQCLKRAIRTSSVFAETTGVDIGIRTKWLINRRLLPRLVKAGKSEKEAIVILEKFVPQYASKLDTSPKNKEKRKTAVLLYLSQAEIARLTQALLENWEQLSDDKALTKLVRTLVKSQKSQTSAPDIALFGRMLAEKPELGLEAACQVAHALSTHRITMEMDFYTAVDDLTSDDTAGAGMMGFTGFNSACFYRYARIDWDQLLKSLDNIDLARLTVEGFLRAAVEAVPSGKQNAFAAHNPPSFMLAAVREGSFAWSLVNAFERPVRARGDSGLVGPSVKKLDAYWQCMVDVYGNDSLVATTALALEPDLQLEALEDIKAPNQEAWIGTVLKALPTKEA